MTCLGAIAGRPVLHSRSPELCANILSSLGMTGSYTRILAGSGAEALELGARMGLQVLQLTSPFKEVALPLLREAAPEVHRTGAVNTVLLGRGWRGHNTDVQGVAAMIREVGLRRGPVAILGAGGAARAAVVALTDAGIGDITLVNRTPSRARRAAGQLGCYWAPLTEVSEVLGTARAVFCCVPGGVLPQELCELGQGPWLDASYTAPERQQACQARGRAFLDGRTWLIAQAMEAMRLLTGQTVSAEQSSELLSSPPPSQPTHWALTGLMGAGKSTLAPLLAQALELPVVDTDQEVERRAGQGISSLWEAQGEAAFRRLEAQVVQDSLRGAPGVVALGGGALLDPDSRRLAAQQAVTAWLWCDPAVAAERIRSTDRPLLARQGMAELLEERALSYTLAADLVVDATGRTPHELAALLLQEARAVRA